MELEDECVEIVLIEFSSEDNFGFSDSVVFESWKTFKGAGFTPEEY